MDLTPERLACLRLIAAHGGSLDHDADALAPFCDDRSTLSKPDVFNQCHDAEWLISRYDNRTDSSTVYLTEKGKSALSQEQHAEDAT